MLYSAETDVNTVNYNRRETSNFSYIIQVQYESEGSVCCFNLFENVWQDLHVGGTHPDRGKKNWCSHGQLETFHEFCWYYSKCSKPS